MSAQQGARLSDALRDRAPFRVIDSFAELRRFLGSSIESIDVIVVGARDATGADAAPVIRDIAPQRPRAAIVAYCQAGSQYSTDIRALAAAGVHQFVFLGIDDSPYLLRNVLDSARRESAAEWVLQQLASTVPAVLHPIVEAALFHPDRVTTVRALANAMSLSRNTLFNRCEEANYLSPAELLMWTRLALVAYLMETTGCSVETIANKLAYSSATALRNAMKRYTGLRPSQVRDAGGLACLIRGLQRRVQLTQAPARKLYLV
jgi:AraC-like DNA-binding protein